MKKNIQITASSLWGSVDMILEVENWRIYYKVLFLRVVNVLFF